VKKYGIVRQAELDSIMLRRKDALCMPGNWDNNTDIINKEGHDQVTTL
jgi:hypothetical protein